MKNLIKLISQNLILRDDVWYSLNKEFISYPEEASDLCFQIETESYWFKHRNNCIVSVVKKFVTKNTIFDIGGGNGFTSYLLEQHGISSVLVEPGINAIQNAKKRNLKNLICSSFKDADFDDNSIPNIGIFDVLEHVEEDMFFLKEIHSALEYEGKLIITVPSYKILWSNIDVLSGHYRRYSRKKLLNMLRDLNFEIEYSTYFFTILIFPIFIFRTIPSIFNSKKLKNTLENKANQHKAGIFEKLFNKFWQFELSLINKKKNIFFGGSCLIVAKKV